MSLRYQRAVSIPAAPDQVFARLDDQTRLAAHMERPSPMMGGGRMTYEFDAERGQAVGSHIKMGGSAFGIRLFVDEVITERAPPERKAWRTEGPVRLLIIGGYRMGFDLAPDGGGAQLRVWINYDLPRGPLRFVGRPLAALYARWCVGRMTEDALLHFAEQGSAQGPSLTKTRPSRLEAFASAFRFSAGEGLACRARSTGADFMNAHNSAPQSPLRRPGVSSPEPEGDGDHNEEIGIGPACDSRPGHCGARPVARARR